MTERLQPGQPAPPFVAETFEGERVDLGALLAHKHVWLAFFRYASCPMCNLRLHELSLAWPRMKTDDVELVAVYQSPPRSVIRWVSQKRPPLRLVTDPEQTLYALYGLECSWLGIPTPRVSARTLKAGALGISLNPLHAEGPIHRLPADFLIEKSGVVREVHYGKDISDHISLAKVARFLSDDDSGSFIDEVASTAA
jgi:peroxiredoxin Q/BCP